MSVVLATVPCARCAAPCLAAPSFWLSGQALCQQCRPAPLAPAQGVVPWRPTIARVLPGELGAILPGRLDRADAELVERTRLAAARYRVLVPAREATPDEIGKGPRAALDLLQDGVSPQVVWATYACAEDTERGALVRSIALRVLGLGYGVWEEGGWSSGLSTHPSPHLCGSLDEWLQHIRGLDWAPPRCPRCARVVRLKNDGQTYAHTRADWRVPLRLECT